MRGLVVDQIQSRVSDIKEQAMQTMESPEFREKRDSYWQNVVEYYQRNAVEVFDFEPINPEAPVYEAVIDVPRLLNKIREIQAMERTAQQHQDHTLQVTLLVMDVVPSVTLTGEQIGPGKGAYRGVLVVAANGGQISPSTKFIDITTLGQQRLSGYELPYSSANGQLFLTKFISDHYEQVVTRAKIFVTNLKHQPYDPTLYTS